MILIIEREFFLAWIIAKVANLSCFGWISRNVSTVRR